MKSLYDIVREDPNIQTYTYGLSAKTKKKRHILNAFLQLTPVCNFKCRMCYARMDQKDIDKAGKHVMSFEEWKYYLDALFRMGVIDITLTGGECTLHPDFSKIYSYCYDKGANMLVMTNASAISEELFELFACRPPRSISVTIYGASQDTYQLLCENPLAYNSVYTNIDRLADVTQELHLKFTAVRENIDDLKKVEKYFRERGHNLHAVDTLIRYDRCDESVIEEESVDHDRFSKIMHHISAEKTGLSIEETTLKYSETTDNCEVPQYQSIRKTGISCAAGRNSCHIDWEGKMTPCVAFNAFSEDPRKIGFEDCWRKLVHWSDNVPIIEECITCHFKLKCNRCIALHYNDTGVFGKPSPRLCWKRRHPEEAKRIELYRKEQLG